MSESAPVEGQSAGKRSAWMTHVKKTMKANKGKPLSAVLKMAKKTYKKTMRGGGIGETAAPLSGGRRRSRRGGVEEEDEDGKVSFPPMQVRRGGRKTRKSKKNGTKKY
jgi:hypothetical protein